MFEWRELFHWERFITPAIIRVFYMLVVILIGLVALSGLLSGLGALTASPFGAMVAIAGSVVGGAAGIFLARIGAEFVLVVFRINEHLSALRAAREYAHGAPVSEPSFVPDEYDR